jgi:hypothetical protein
MQYEVTASPATKKYIEALLPSMFKQLKLSNSKKFLFIKVDKDIEHAGETVPLLGLDSFIVAIKPTRNKVSLGVTLAHELVHVAQFAKGILQPTPKAMKWAGKCYSRKTPYLDMPWEVQAFAKQEIIFRRAID